MKVSFSASLWKITTTIDGGWRISFDVPDSENEHILKLSQMRNLLLQLGVDLALPIEGCEGLDS